VELAHDEEVSTRASSDRVRHGLPATGNSPPLQQLLVRQVGDRVQATFDGEQVEVRVEPRSGRADLALVAMAVAAQSDLVVVGTNGAGLSKAILGSVAGGIVATLRRPVLVVNPVTE
jgi:nucleotide-binding universal stress UspA family protein